MGFDIGSSLFIILGTLCLIIFSISTFLGFMGISIEKEINKRKEKNKNKRGN